MSGIDKSFNINLQDVTNAFGAGRASDAQTIFGLIDADSDGRITQTEAKAVEPENAGSTDDFLAALPSGSFVNV